MRFRPESFTSDDELMVLGSAQKRCLGPVIRCLIWNIYKARRRSWSDDFKYLIADRDLVLLQEAVLGAPSDLIFTDSMRFQWNMARSFKDPVSGVEHGVKTGAVASASSAHFYLSQYSEPLSQTQKLLLACEYCLGDSDEEEQRLLVLNMHAINFVSVHKYVAQLDQLEWVLEAHSGPILLAGDFNTWSAQRLSRFLAVSQGAGLQEAVIERRSRLAHLNCHLDHVFYRGLTLRSVESLSHIKSSDHYPITATFEWSPS